MREYRIGPETPRLIMRAFEPADAEALFRMTTEPEVIRYTGQPPIASVEEARGFIENYPDWRENGFGRWACWLKSEQKIIGFSGLKRLSDYKNEVDVGYRFFPEYWGRGFATESSKASLEFGFETLKLERIIGLVAPENTRSAHVLEKLGMTSEGEDDYAGMKVIRYAIDRAAWRRAVHTFS